jgi:predicted Zn-dependent protease
VRKVKGELEKAVALDSDGKNLSARADLAEFYVEAPGFMGGDKTKARALIEFVMKSDAALAHSMAANLAREQKKNVLAEQEYKAAIEAGGGEAHYQVMLASFYRKTGRLDEMEATIGKIGKGEVRGVALFDAAANLLSAGRNFSAAIEMLRRYLRMETLSEEGPAFEGHFLMGQLLERQGDRPAAAQEYRAALALASQFHPARDALAAISR